MLALSASLLNVEPCVYPGVGRVFLPSQSRWCVRASAACVAEAQREHVVELPGSMLVQKH